MKKIVLCLAFIMVLTVQAFADVIIMPENGFYAEHEEEIKYVGQTFQAIRDTSLCSKPNGAIIDVLKKGEKLYIDSVYFDSDGQGYGMHTNELNDEVDQYWVNLSDTEMAYDERVFYYQFEDDIKEYDGCADNLDFTKTMIIYTYPGADTYYEYSWTSIIPTMFQQFTDETGKIWVNAAAGWINVDNPYDKTEPINREIPEDYSVIPEITVNDLPDDKDNTLNYIIAGTLVLIACVTAIVVIFKKHPHE